MRTTILTLFLSAGCAFAQQATSASGGEATGAGGTSSYTVGQPIYKTHSGSGGSSAEGVQQVYKLTNDINEITDLEIKTYPNPTTALVVLEIPEFATNALSYTMVDVNGKVLQSGQITEANTELSCVDLAKGTYVIKVTKQDGATKNYKLVKL